MHSLSHTLARTHTHTKIARERPTHTYTSPPHTQTHAYQPQKHPLPENYHQTVPVLLWVTPIHTNAFTPSWNTTWRSSVSHHFAVYKIVNKLVTSYTIWPPMTIITLCSLLQRDFVVALRYHDNRSGWPRLCVVTVSNIMMWSGRQP